MFIIRKVAENRVEPQEGEWGRNPDLAGILTRASGRERKEWGALVWGGGVGYREGLRPRLE